MNIINRTILRLHKTIGLIISVFFIMWFVSGIVLLYHHYPRVTDSDLYSHMEILNPEELPDILSLPGFSDSISFRTLSVSKNLNEIVWQISQSGKVKETPMDYNKSDMESLVLADSVFVSQKQITSNQLDSIALAWGNGGNIIKVDTLRNRQQWIMYERYEKYLPILRYYIDDKDKTEVFIGQESGEVLQATTASQRFWAWIGAIPHKLYIPFLRKDVKTWENVLFAGGLLCLLAALSGMYLGIYFLVKNYRKHRRITTPFKKGIWKWHHISGLIFGIFLICWGVSGCLAMQRVPKWLVNYDGDYFLSASKFWGKKPLELSAYKLDYRDIFKKYEDIKKISWQHFGNVPAYLIVAGDKEIVIDASQPEIIKELQLSEKDIRDSLKKYYGDDVKFTIVLMDDYDEYYLSQKDGYPLPVWKVDVLNDDGARLYISPKDGYIKYLNNNRMAKKWLFSATHYLGIKYFVLHEPMRLICLWMLCIGCVIVCVSGIGIFLSRHKNKIILKNTHSHKN